MKLASETVIREAADLLQTKFQVQCERQKLFPWLKFEGKPITPAIYFGPPVNCFFAFDSADHFNAARLETLDRYPADVPLGFDFQLYRELCRRNPAAIDGRMRRQANQDSVLDLLPPKRQMNPTLRLAEAEMRDRISGPLTASKLRGVIGDLLEDRVGFHAGTTFLQLLEHPSGKPSQFPLAG